MKTVQYFSNEYLEQARRTPPHEVLQYLESFRLLHGGPSRASRLISMRIPQALLDAFKHRCKADEVRYQTKIKELMLAWIDE